VDKTCWSDIELILDSFIFKGAGKSWKKSVTDALRAHVLDRIILGNSIIKLYGVGVFIFILRKKGLKELQLMRLRARQHQYIAADILAFDVLELVRAVIRHEKKTR